MLIRFGYEIIYQCPQPTPMILNLHAHYSRASDLVQPDHLCVDPPVPITMYRDGFGNWCSRIVAPAGRVRLFANGLIRDHGRHEPVLLDAIQHSVETLPEETLVYLLGSRYCETDLLTEVAWKLFGHTPPRLVAGAGGLRFRQSPYPVRLRVRAADQDRLRGLHRRSRRLSRLRASGQSPSAAA